MKFDLHVHTNYSDGKFKPSKVIDIAVERNLNGIAITDHDTVSGLDEAIEYSKQYKNFKVIPGIELGCVYNDEEVHILGYFIDYNSKELLKVTEQLRKNRVERGKEIIDKLRDLNIGISQNEVQSLSKEDFIGRVHIARVLVKKNYAASIADAFERYLNKNSIAYVARETLTIEESINLINSTNGIAVLAHPGLLKEKEIIINYCIKNGIQGIECIHSKHSQIDTEMFKNIAKKEKLLITAGSDCHGEIIDNDLLLGKFYIGKDEMSRIERLI
ncbi:PHP domain-containing protein [Tissierella creatinophila]|uniref:DNA polymerase III PolC-type n=1 Tax=Tissierella creatinophila DSM 6911 TaxID=1123403 RepID=A0A1U7M9K8_TISCR|nr:PHP domain-containing protein [Tissierella creatinophila]OLS03975.1 DNA polymerase III PolC-type [Tissierella creatinophila DSM 6911]